MDKIIELAQKIKALADRGIGGEKLNAQQQLERIMKKYKLTIEDIEGDKKEFAAFKVNRESCSLFDQVVSTVLGVDFELYTDKRKRNCTILLVTACEAVQIRIEWEFYSKLYAQELELFYDAFILKNRLYPKNGTAQNLENLTEEQLEKLRRTIALSKSIQKGKPQKQLEHI